MLEYRATAAWVPRVERHPRLETCELGDEIHVRSRACSEGTKDGIRYC